MSLSTASSDLLHQCTVLVLNRNWQAVHVKTPADAFCMLVAGSALGLDIHETGEMNPLNWGAWMRLPVRGADRAVRTTQGPVRVPTVIVAAHYARVPVRRPAFGARGIWERDGGVCQYTGRKLSPQEGNIDHVLPRSRGGPSTWENCVLAHRDVNSRKANRLPQEAGLALLRRPSTPRSVPVTLLIRNVHGIADWEPFLVRK